MVDVMSTNIFTKGIIMKKKKRRLSPNAKWGIALLAEIFVVIILAICYLSFYTNQKFNMMHVIDLNEEDVGINEGTNEDQKGYTTIAVFGIDARSTESMGEGNRSDTIMIASINNETKEVKIVSVYRDTFLEIADGSGVMSKVNAAYSYGGPELAIKTLNANLDLNITEFVTINFLALTKAVDDLGGVEVGIESNELPMLNAAISEQIQITGIYSDGVFNTGTIRLNGTQATAYSRIRSTDQGDITRTERQREVLFQMFAQMKKSNLTTIDTIIDDVFPNIYTSITKSEMLDLAKSVFSYEMGPTVGFPLEYAPVSHSVSGSILVPADLTSNVSALHEFLFGTANYVPTQKVQDTSVKIQNNTGVPAREINIEPFLNTN